MTLASGTKLGAFEILSAIGAGGMGEVYKAKDTRLGRDVAVKVLPEEFFESEEKRQRFEREARLLAALNHPNIAGIHSFEEIPSSSSFSSSTIHILVMELVEGEDLAQRLASGPLPLEESLSCARQIAEALEAAHEKGIVHRDLKPANVKVTPDGRVKLLDFGLAKIFEGDAGPGSAPSVTHSPTLSARATAAGVVLGTMPYMSPEQAKGKPVDKRTDIWAFGVVLFEMLAGRRLFTGETVSDVLVSVLTKEPDWAALPEQTPRKIRDLLRRCLRREPKQRLHDIADARLDLEELAASAGESGQLPFEETTALPGPTVGRSAQAATGRGSRRSLYLSWTITAAFAAAAGVFGVLALRGRAPAPAAGTGVRFQIAPPAGGTFTGMVALSPDGLRLAAVVTGADGRDRIFMRPLDALEMRSVPGTEGAAYPFFSPDGQRIAFFANGTLRFVDLEKGIIQTICKARNPRGGVWGADGFILFAPNGGGGIDRVPAGGGEPSRIGTLSARDVSLRWPALLPDGRHFVYFAFGEEGKSQLILGSLGSTTTVPLAPADSGAIFFRNSLCFLRDGRLVRVPFDLASLKINGPAEPLAEDVYWDLVASGYAGFAVSDTGVVAWLGGGIALSRLVWHDRSGKVLGTVGPPGPYFEPDLSPDEKTLAVSRMASEANGVGIWLLDLLRGSFGRLSLQPTAVTALWRSDGKSVAYSTYPKGSVYVRDAGTSSNAETLFENGVFCVLDDWAPDGRLFFSSVESMATFRTRILVRPAGGGTPRPVLSGPFSVMHARLSPDGRWLAYVSDESGVDEVLVRSYPGGSERFTISAGGGTQPRWRGDGRELFYVTPDAKIMSVPIATAPRFALGAAKVLFQSQILPLVEARNHYAVTRDGQRFLVNSRREDAATLPIVVVTASGAGARK